MNADDHGRQLAPIPQFFRGLCRVETLRQIDGWMARYGYWVLLVVALFYYGQYYRSGLNLGGEGGTEGVIALRLMEGQRPIIDTFLGYNVMWFYPVVWLFQIVGPSYLALRIYFFSLCVIGSVLGFFTLRRITGSGLYAVLVALLPLLMPGMLFRNYMPFLGLLNMFILLQAYVFAQKSPGRQIAWMAAAGLALGLTFLIRIDLGIFFAAITAGLIVLYPFARRKDLRPRLSQAAIGTLVVLVMVLLAHLPVYLDARNRGFAESFIGQYTVWTNYLQEGLQGKMGKRKIRPAPVEVIDKEGAPPSAIAKENRKGLQRPSLSDLNGSRSFYDKAYVVITYLPILVSAVILVAGGMVFLISLLREREEERVTALALLTCLGCALALFPQFFIFRPDTPHLSEFMAPFLIALGGAAWVAFQWAMQASSLILRIGAFGLVALCAVEAVLYTYHTMPKESAGTIAATHRRNVEFSADNGVRVLVKKQEKEDLQAIYDTVAKYSRPDDYVVCYPYAPTINFMTNRRSYEYNLYVDNATAPGKFHDLAVQKMTQYRPAILVIDNRDINKSDASRFSNWAKQTYAFIRENYKLAGHFHRQEVYVRPDLFEAHVATP